MKIIESYKRTLNNIRLLSKITSFLIAIFIFLEIFQSLYTYSFNLPESGLSNDVWRNFFLSLAFQFLIAAIFTARFILLFFKNSKYIWFSQIIWIISWLSILAYHLTTRKVYFGSFFGEREFGCMDCMYYDTFLYVSEFLTVVLFGYLFLSPLKQILVFVYALGNRKIPNHVMK